MCWSLIYYWFSGQSFRATLIVTYWMYFLGCKITSLYLLRLFSYVQYYFWILSYFLKINFFYPPDWIKIVIITPGVGKGNQPDVALVRIWIDWNSLEDTSTNFSVGGIHLDRKISLQKFTAAFPYVYERIRSRMFTEPFYINMKTGNYLDIYQH